MLKFREILTTGEGIKLSKEGSVYGSGNDKSTLYSALALALALIPTPTLVLALVLALALASAPALLTAVVTPALVFALGPALVPTLAQFLNLQTATNANQTPRNSKMIRTQRKNLSGSRACTQANSTTLYSMKCW